MRVHILIGIIMLLGSRVLGQAPEVRWHRALGGPNGDYAFSVEPTSDGGYIMAGQVESGGGDILNYHGNILVGDIWVVKTDNRGLIEWQKTLGGTFVEQGAWVHQTPDGGYVVAGSSQSADCGFGSPHGPGIDYMLIKLKPNGDMAWKKYYGGSKHEYLWSMSLTPDGGFVMAGHSESVDGDVTGNHGGRDFWVVKTDGSGTLEWQKSLGGSADEEAYGISVASDGGYFVTGESRSNDGDVSGNHGQVDMWTVKLDANGGLQWQKSLGSSGFDQGWTVQSTADGGCVTAGYAGSNDGDVAGGHGAQDFWLVKLNSGGGIDWQRCYGGSKNEICYAMAKTSDGGYVLAGSAESSDGQLTCHAGITDGWIVKVASDGTLEWQKNIGGSSYEEIHSIQQLSDGGFIMAGSTCSRDVFGWHQSSNQGSCADFWLVRLGAAGIPAPAPSATIVPLTPVCTTTGVWFKALGEYVGTNASFVWKVNGSIVGYGDEIAIGVNASGQTISVTVTPGGACATAGAPFTVQYTPVVGKTIAPPSITIFTATPTICSCTPLEFTAQVGNPGNAPKYTWTVNNNIVGSNSALTDMSFQPGDKIQCSIEDKSDCFTGGIVKSVIIQLTNGTGLSAGISIKGPVDPVCQGSTISYTATAINAGTSPVYQWQVNGVNAGTNSSQFSSSSLADGDIVSCVLTPDVTNTCSSSANVNSNAIKVALSTPAVPSVTVSTPKNIVCIGQTVNFTADVQHAGSTPSYQWTVNGSNTGTNSNSFSTNALSDGDVVTCDVTVDPLFTCATTTSVNSAPISMTVKNQGNPGLSLAVTGNDVCPGVPVSFAATVTDGGTGYTLQWKVNGKTYNENTAAFSRSNLNNGDLVSCIVTPGSDACLTDILTSNVITAVIRTEPVVRVDPADTIVLYGSTMKLRGLISGGYSSFVWSDASKVVDPSSLTPVTTPVTEDRVYTLVVTNSDGCTASGSATVVVTRLLAMPSGFTPNADGKNDVFRIPPGIHIKLEAFAVYDRYGERVFFTQDPTIGWDGTFGGHPAPAGTYVYYVQGVDVKGPVYGKGTVVLVR